jgi:hypothetical protein
MTGLAVPGHEFAGKGAEVHAAIPAASNTPSNSTEER